MDELRVTLKLSSSSPRVIWEQTMELHDDRFVFRKHGAITCEYRYDMIKSLRRDKVLFRDGKSLRIHPLFNQENWLEKLTARLKTAGNKSAVESLWSEVRKLRVGGTAMIALLAVGTCVFAAQALQATGFPGLSLIILMGAVSVYVGQRDIKYQIARLERLITQPIDPENPRIRSGL